MAKLHISEFSNIASASGSQAAAVPPVATQVVDFSGGVQTSAAFNRSTWIIRVQTDAICSVRFDGSAATTSHMRMVAGQTEYFGVQPGSTLSVISGTSYTNKSGTISSGGAAQTLAALNASRTGLSIQNLSTGDLWISSLGTAAATQPSLWLPPGSYFEFPETGVPTTAVSIYGATTGQAFAAREW